MRDLTEIMQYMVIGVIVVVVAVPEGLPLAVTISLAYSVKKMLKDKNLVRQVSASETMGAISTICSDKTGTLTMNMMRVVKGWFAGKFYDTVPKATELNHTVLNLLIDGIVVNSRANILTQESAAAIELIIQGNRTEAALLLMVLKNFDTDYKPRRAELSNYMEKMFMFSSQKKRMTTIIRIDNRFRLFTKGASEIILELCTTYLNQDGQPEYVLIRLLTTVGL